MNLIFIYGPPAVGKYTVGAELANHTGYALFHNHLTVPAVNAIFGEKSPARSKLLKNLRLTAIAAGAEAGINMIFTAAYSGGPGDEEFIQSIIRIVESTPNGRVMFVQLYASSEVLLSRVSSESRRLLGMQKMTDVRRYRQQLETRNIRVSIPHQGVLLIDNSKLSPRDVARMIVRHFQL